MCRRHNIFFLMTSCCGSRDMHNQVAKLPKLFLGPQFFWGRAPKCLTEFYKPGSPSNMWQSLLTINQATSEIKWWKKKISAAKHNSNGQHNCRQPQKCHSPTVLSLFLSNYQIMLLAFYTVVLGARARRWTCKNANTSLTPWLMSMPPKHNKQPRN